MTRRLADLGVFAAILCGLAALPACDSNAGEKTGEAVDEAAEEVADEVDDAVDGQ